MTVTSTNAAAVVIPHLATTLHELYKQRSDIENQIEDLVTEHPLFLVLTSIPGAGVRTTAMLITEIAGKDFESAAHLASYAGLTPQTRQSGTSIKSETVSHTGNKRLKRALFLSAFASLRADPVSRRYYDKKRLAGKRHNQALIALAHKRLTLIFAMRRDRTFYETKPVTLAA